MLEPAKATVDERAATTMEGGIEVTRLIDGEKLKVGLAIGDPGDKETWHQHKDEVEEVYYTLEGAGRIAWAEDETEHDMRVEPGEAVCLPTGGFYHEIEAVGDDGWTFLYAINAIDSDTYRK